MGLIIETDLGRDPDDFFAICYLIAANIRIDALFITPGDPDQIAIGKFLSKYLSQNFRVLASKPNRDKRSSGGVHYQLLNKYKYPLVDCPDEVGVNIDNKDIFVIGPPTKIGDLIIDHPVNNMTIQGGFIGYDIHGLNCQRLEKFEGKTSVSTFNLGGAVQQAHNIVEHSLYNTKRFVSKNLCHTIIYNQEIHDLVCSYGTDNKALNLLKDGMSLYLANHKDGKKFHDPTAAVCHVHPEIATWVKAKLYSDGNKWGSRLDENGCDIIVDIDRDKLWEYIAKGI